ncbi:MAG: DUF371 domain-containing protein [Pyrobaculum sp.]
MSCIEATLRGEVPYDVFTARGHQNITALNTKTLEITKDSYVTKRGDCIVACCSEKAAGELRNEVREAMKKRGEVVVIIDAGMFFDYVLAYTPGVMPTSKWRIVVRKSAYVDDSTVAILSRKAAADLDRRLVRELKNGIPVRIVVGVCPIRI